LNEQKDILLLESVRFSTDIETNVPSTHTRSISSQQRDKREVNFTRPCTVLLVWPPSSRPLEQTFWTPWFGGARKAGCYRLPCVSRMELSFFFHTCKGT